MRYISCKLDDLKKIVLPIGYEGENEHTRVQVDAGEVFKEYPAAVPSLKVHGPTGAIYPAEVTRDGKNVIWDIKASDCAADGSGEAQFTFTLNNVIVKSCIAKIKVYRSIVGGSTPPDPVQDWLDEAQDVLDDLEAAEVHQPMIGVDGYWYTWDQENEEYTKTETKAQGEDGQPGPAGQDGAPGQDATPALITVNYSDLTFPVAKDTQCYHDGLLYYAKQDIQTSEAWAAAHWQQTTVEEQQSLLKNDIQGKYEKPSGGIPSSDMTSAVQTSLGKADSAYQKPSGGISRSDIASGVLPYVTPEMYGAVGDGVADDSIAIAAMFAVDSPVYVMNGDYICDSEIRIQNKKNITITGTGSIYKHSTVANSRLFDFLECENIHVEGITFKSTNDKTPDSPGEHSVRTGALLSNVHTFTIDNSSFITFTKVRFIQIGYCFTIGTWNTTSSEEKYRTRNICMNDIEMKNCGMGIYCQNISDLYMNDWIFDDMAISPGGYHMFYGTTCLKNINLMNLAFNGNAYSDDVILVQSISEDGVNGDSNVVIENITAKCSHFASTEPNTCMTIKNAIIEMHNHYSEDMVSGNSSVIITYNADSTAPNVVFENCIIYHVDGTDKPLIAANEINVNLKFINCDIRLNIGAYSVHDVSFFNCKMSGRRLVNTSLNTNFKTNVTFKECDIVAQGYSVLFNTNGKLILDNCRFQTNHSRIIHSTEQAGTIYAYNNIMDSSYSGGGSVVFGLDSTYLSGYRDLNNTVYANS